MNREKQSSFCDFHNFTILGRLLCAIFQIIGQRHGTTAPGSSETQTPHSLSQAQKTSGEKQACRIFATQSKEAGGGGGGSEPVVAQRSRR
jgi:hypothetical protein